MTDEAEYRERMEWRFLFMLLGGQLVLAFVFGVFHVEEKTSFGLGPLLESLRSLTGIMASYKFGKAVKETT